MEAVPTIQAKRPVFAFRQRLVAQPGQRIRSERNFSASSSRFLCILCLQIGETLKLPVSDLPAVHCLLAQR